MAENTFRVKKSKMDNLTVDGDATLSGVNVSGDLAVNTDTLFVDSTNNRVGFGTASPSHPAHFVGSSTTSEYISLFAANGTTPEAGQISSLSSKGVAVQSNGGAYYFGRDPLNNIEFAMGTSSAGSVFSASLSNHDYQIRTNNTNRIHVESSNGNVGIGTTSPDASYKLDVAGDIRTQSAIDASDANLTLGSAITVDQAGGYVGIGNSSPSYALDIPFGDINVGGYVYAYDLDVGNNATISAGYLACSSFYDAGGSSQWGSESGGTFTFNGAVNIGGQAEATSQAASTDDSLMTRSLGDARYGMTLTSYKTTNEDKTSDTTRADDNELALTLEANSVYIFEIIMPYKTQTTGSQGISFGVSVPTGATIEAHYDVASGANWRFIGRRFTATTTRDVNYGNTNGEAQVRIKGTIDTAGTAGTFAPKWAQATSSANYTRVVKGAYMIAHKIQ